MSLPDNVSELNLKIPGTDCSNNGSWNPKAPLPKLRTKTAWFGVNWSLVSRLS